jgi:hypothetical protein
MPVPCRAARLENYTLNALFFGDSRMFRTLNNAYIVLLPKIPDASMPSDYRPITMIHSFGKLASKLLAARLAPKLPQIISPSPNENAFIRARTIHDNYKIHTKGSRVHPKE